MMSESNRHVLVTGGAGFIGSHVAARLISDGYKVTVLDNLSTGKIENIPKEADFIELDLGKQESYCNLENLTCSHVFHLAGQSSGEASFDNPYYDLMSHVMSAFWLLDWCKRQGVSRFLFASSMSVYGDPSFLPVDENHSIAPKTFYGAGKAAAEAYVRLYQTIGIDTTIFRLFSVYGPGQNLDNRKQGMVSIFLSYLLEKKEVVVKGEKGRFRDFVYIDDVVDAWLASLGNPVTSGKTYNLASGRKTTVGQLLEGLKHSFGCPEHPVEFKDGTLGDQFGALADISLVRRDIGWAPRVSLKEGLRRMVTYEQERFKHG